MDADDTATRHSSLSEHLARYRLAMYHGKRTQWVFHHTTTNRRRRAGERIRSLYKRFNDAVQRADIPKIRPHDSRHRRVTVWLAEGKNPVHVKEAVGHADIATTMKYYWTSRDTWPAKGRATVSAAPPIARAGIDRPPARTSRAQEKNDGPDGRSSGLAGGPATRGSRVNITTDPVSG